MKRMIFHTPLPLNPAGNSGSHIRPIQMLKAFKDSGFEVDVVAGYANERKEALRKIKKNVKEGLQYDFLYSETSTMPMFLTEKNHLPFSSWVELSLFRLCKNYKIPIAFYYRDIHWKFNFFQRGTSNFKRLVSLFFYFLELITIKYFYNLLFLPSIDMQKELPILKSSENVFELPPGIPHVSSIDQSLDLNNKQVLNLIYVGGVNPPVYDISLILNAVKNSNNAHLHLVCRKEDLNNLSRVDYVHDRITIYHASGDELKNIYSKADLAVVALGDHPYHDFSMPVKMFEAIGHCKPIIVSNSMKAASRFVSKHQIGYVVKNEQDLQKTIDTIIENPNSRLSIVRNLIEFQKEVTWIARANEVYERTKRIKRDS